jgi:hypothetical protein
MSAPVEVVVGATDLDATTRFLATFDLEVVAEGTVAVTDADSGDGQAGSTSWRRLGVPGADRGTIRLVATDLPGGPRPAIAAGPLAVDLYTRDMDASLARLAGAGIDHGRLGTLDLGPLVMRQCEVIAPDGWRIVLVEANHRRPTTLDDDPDRLHSEVHSVLWTVPSIEEATPALVDLGLTQAHVFPIQHPELARIIDLPAPDTTLVMNLLVDNRPRRPFAWNCASSRSTRRQQATSRTTVTGRRWRAGCTPWRCRPTRRPRPWPCREASGSSTDIAPGVAASRQSRATRGSPRGRFDALTLRGIEAVRRPCGA